MTKYDSLEINTAEICVTLEITRTFKGSWNWYLHRFQQKNIMDTIEEGILNALVCSTPNLQKLEIRHFGNKPFNCAVSTLTLSVSNLRDFCTDWQWYEAKDTVDLGSVQHKMSQLLLDFCDIRSKHGRLAGWRKWRASDVGEAKEVLENELWRRWSNGRVGEWAVT